MHAKLEVIKNVISDAVWLFQQGMGFLHKYVRLRGKCQESMYNIGRAFHQLGAVTAVSIL